MTYTEYLGKVCLRDIKGSRWFPVRSGKLRDQATYGQKINENAYTIVFDSSVANYIEFLQEGTKEHDIPFAFVGKGNWVWWYPYGDGVPFLMGMGGRFNGKFHPGSQKHKHFISNKAVWHCIREIKRDLRRQGYVLARKVSY